jgi:hypothetical protein
MPFYITYKKSKCVQVIEVAVLEAVRWRRGNSCHYANEKVISEYI